ncbi:MAG: 1,4-dihydroxy-6-naphthoate synthase [Deltaproteobacteria bacterium]|nr:MAG: 1,4-dihydroxy-6-naphthoate synthase [Deltaproteobacteria bacterium]
MLTAGQDLTLGYSTCPNDTFLFHALAQGLIQCDPFQFSVFLEDVETLNQKAKSSVFHVSKLSFAAIGHLLDTYALLRSGAALGRGCGPLIVARPGMKLENILSGRIAVPGLWTTAFLLLTLYLNKTPETIPMTFDRIMPSLQKGEIDYGIIIHEGRFTYPEYGLIKLLDLGAWWEQTTSMPIPLGGICIRRSLGPDIARKIESLSRESVEFAFRHPESSREYVAKHAQEMSPAIVQQHIDLYVNSFTIDLGEEGVKAVETLFSMARESGAIPDSSMPVFAYE